MRRTASGAASRRASSSSTAVRSPTPQSKALQDSVLENMLAPAHDPRRGHGYRVSETDVRQAVAEEPAFQIEGKYSPEAAKARLAAGGMTPRVRDELRQDLERRR